MSMLHTIFAFEFANAPMFTKLMTIELDLKIFSPSFKDVRRLFVICELFLILQPAM